MFFAYLSSLAAVGSLLFCPNLTYSAGCCLLYGGRFDSATSGGPRHEGFGLHRRFEITMYDIVVVSQDTVWHDACRSWCYIYIYYVLRIYIYKIYIIYVI